MTRAATHPAARGAPPTVCFDLDGTLLDSYEGLTRSYAHALTVLGRAVPAMDVLRTCIGPPLRENFARLLATADAALVEEAVRVFRVRYDAVGWSESRLYDGVEAMLAAVERLDVTLLLTTAKPQKFADRIVAHFGLDRFLDASFGPTLDGALDDKRRLMAHVIARTGLDPARAALVGDRHTDVVAATTHGIVPVGVTWGYGTRDELVDAGATIVCATPAEVVARLAAWRATHPA